MTPTKIPVVNTMRSRKVRYDTPCAVDLDEAPALEYLMARPVVVSMSNGGMKKENLCMLMT